MEYTNEHIENYLKGKLTAQDASAFESISNQNPELKAELAYEKMMSKAITSHRKMALKARLNSIPVAPVAFSGSIMSMGSAAIKTAAAVVAGVGIGAGLYFYSQTSTETTKTTQISKVEVAQPQVVAENKSENNSQVISESKEQKDITETQQTEKQSIVTASIKREPKKLTKTVPNMLAFEDNSQADVLADADDSPLSKKVESTIHRIFDIEVKMVEDSKYNFHYKLKDNVLMLYGKFEASQYEILEFNSTTGTNLYFYYNSNYYGLKKNVDEIEKLKAISDKKTAAELDLARSR